MPPLLRCVAAIGLAAISLVLASPALAVPGDAADIAAAPARRADYIRTYARCVNNVSLIDCGKARADAIVNYQMDSALHHNAMLCEDRGQVAQAVVSQFMLRDNIANSSLQAQDDTAFLDALLGEMIDNCPERAKRALEIRRTLHGL